MTTVPFKPPNAEADFLITCARVHLLEAHVRHLHELLARPLDWDCLVALAARHSLLPLLGWHVQTLAAAAIPATVKEQLHARQKGLALRNLGLSGELVRILRLFDEHHIPAMPFKGPTLALFAYGNVALREFDDLDLLLRPVDFFRAQALFVDQGYRPKYALTPLQEMAYMQTLRQFTLEKPERAVVELHTALSPRAFAFDLGLASLWSRHVVVQLTGHAILSPGAEDLLLILCMHGAKHLWKNLGWICDVAELLRVQTALNWDQVCREARRLRSERLFRLGVNLAERVLQAPLPPEMSQAARRDATVRTLADQVLRHLLGDTEWRPSGLESGAFHLQLREQPRDGIRFCLSLLLTPTLADWQTRSLPLAFLYYFIRPLRLLGKYLRLSG